MTESLGGAKLDSAEIVACWPVSQKILDVGGHHPIEDRDCPLIARAGQAVRPQVCRRDGRESACRLSGVERIPPVVTQFPYEIDVETEIRHDLVIDSNTVFIRVLIAQLRINRQ